MYQLYVEMLEVMDAAFQDFAAALPKPVRVKHGPGWVFRFKDRDIHHAVVLKLALVQSTLRAALVLLEHGHTPQQAMLQRVIDEANEDILFLVYAVTHDTVTPLHQRYLDAFWAEEFGDANDPTGTHQSRDMVPRQKIRAYLAKIEGKDLDPSRAVQVTKVLSQTYSGFIHGASAHIMETYGGMPLHFHTRGMLNTPRITEYANDLWNYMYRGLCSHAFAAKLFGAQEHFDQLVAHSKRFEAAMGKQYGQAKT
ncbi:hypothetical protein [Rhodanobacter aciditrophus]|uniref:hypothetical protein n=1 Tax=Rhodanobacter aciditrophus TaxID=1623218 RepID=UPI003CF99F07